MFPIPSRWLMSYMDIFNPTWTAQIFFDDTANLLMSSPIKTGSKITITGVETALGWRAMARRNTG